MSGRPVYMDHNATTPVLPEVLEAMLPWFGDEFGNASSTTHVYGKRARQAVNEARQSVAALIGARPEEIIFTSGATESDNLALRGVACAATGRDAHIVTTAIEHEAVLETCQSLREEGCEVTVVPVDRHGLVDPADIERAMTDRTLLVSVMMANNEIGTIQPLAEIGELCRQRGVLMHSDAVQAAGRLPMDVDTLKMDLASLTAHKMYGPKGVGALYLREGVGLEPILTGSGQEGSLRSGTLNVPGIVGFGKAAEVALRDMATEPARQQALRDRLWSRISSRIDGVVLNGHPTRRLSNTLNVGFQGIESESLLMLAADAAALSSGSACASGNARGSYVIRAISRGPEAESASRSAIRFGLGRSNTEHQIDGVVEALARGVERLRAMAPTVRAVDAV
jgi:cysteine desulfurase